MMLTPPRAAGESGAAAEACQQAVIEADRGVGSSPLPPLQNSPAPPLHPAASPALSSASTTGGPSPSSHVPSIAVAPRRHVVRRPSKVLIRVWLTRAPRLFTRKDIAIHFRGVSLTASSCFCFLSPQETMAARRDG